MEREKSEAIQKIFMKKVIQKLYHTPEDDLPFERQRGSREDPIIVHHDSQEEDVFRFAPKVPKNDAGLTRGGPYHGALQSAGELNASLRNNNGGHRIMTCNERVISDRLSPYLSDDEDSDDKVTKKRKRKRFRHHHGQNPSIRLENRSSSSSSLSSQIQHLDSALKSSQTSPSGISQNRKRKLKRKRREKRRKIENSDCVMYTFKSNNQC